MVWLALSQMITSVWSWQIAVRTAGGRRLPDKYT